MNPGTGGLSRPAAESHVGSGCGSRQEGGSGHWISVTESPLGPVFLSFSLSFSLLACGAGTDSV
ncbi:unnamed protein product [Eretmochelys imbricata]